MAYDEIYEKVMNSGIFEQGIEIGLEQGREEVSLKWRLRLRTLWVLMKL